MSDQPNATETALESAFAVQRSRYVIGIDLGTTNCAMAFVDTQRPSPRVEIFSIEQLVDFGVVAQSQTLPSFHYELTPSEVSSVEERFQFSLPERASRHVGIVGILARERAMQVPGRGIASAKSWLCHTLVDRESDMLPWHGDEQVERLSPIEASARYLKHLSREWDRSHPQSPMSQQEVVVTLPASFDEVARRLTLEAAKRAGLERVILIEEPQAAFYAWLDRHPQEWMQILKPGDCILVCDIGGGTTDFTLIRVIDSSVVGSETTSQGNAEDAHRIDSDVSGHVNRKLQSAFGLHRVAVGPHLMLGGDNLDLALAHFVEQRLKDTGNASSNLTPRQWDVLKAHARKAKESLLGDQPPEQYTVSLPGSGSKLIANTQTVTIERAWALQLLIDGFFGRVEIDAKPDRSQTLFQEFGLPYESEPSVPRHLAQFLWEHRWAGRPELDRARFSELLAARPDWVLFNGGVLESKEIRNAILDQIAYWFAPASEPEWKPKLLEGNRHDLSVACGAAYFGLARRGEGVRIDARLARAYYLLVQQNPAQAMCVMPASAMPLDCYRLDQHPFDLVVGQPVQFPLYYSSTQLTHAFGDLVDVDPRIMTPLPPIQTVLEWGRGRRTGTIPVVLESELSEIGTLNLSVVTQADDSSESNPVRWSLQFDVRGGTPGDLATEGTGSLSPLIDSQRVERGLEALDRLFGVSPTEPLSECYNVLGAALGANRREWPPSLLRALWSYLHEQSECRNRSAETEARWLNLVGWCLRPGFGFPADDWRVQNTWRSVHNKLIHRSLSGVSESVILWRRIAGGFTEGQQNALYQDAWTRLKSTFGGGAVGSQQLSTNVVNELLRLLGSLERLRVSDKTTVVNGALSSFAKKKLAPMRGAILWMVGRMGSRVPVYASLQQTIPTELAVAWIERLLSIEDETLEGSMPSYSLALMLMARRTGDRYRDVPESVRDRVLMRLEQIGAPEIHRRLVADIGQLGEDETSTVVGDALPLGFTLRTP